jgi:serine phosphatase RsbU (regulator of sigma subunit)
VEGKASISDADRRPDLMTYLRAWLSLRRRHSPGLVYLACAALVAVFLGLLGLLSSSKTLLGIPGSGSEFVVVLAAVLAGPVVGVLVALTAGAFFLAFIADLGSVGSPAGTIAGIAIWTASGVIAGRVADALRASTREREAQEEAAALHAALESGLLPRFPLAHPNLSVLTRYIPSEGRLRLGGDFIGIVTVEGGSLAMVIGDVAGHGPSAAAVGTRLRAAWRALVLAGSDPAGVLTTLNKLVLAEDHADGMFVTACLAWLDERDGRLTYVAAGHPPMVLIDEEGCRLLETHPTLPLGVAEPLLAGFSEVALTGRWSLFAYTDGLIEGRDSPSSPARFGEDRLLARLSGLGPCGLTETSLDGLLHEMREANGGPAADDIAVVAISRTAVLTDGAAAHAIESAATLTTSA